MEIAFLYFKHCPTYTKAYKLLLLVLREEKITTQVKRIEISNDDAQKHKIIGSPTIRVNGTDIDDSSRDNKTYVQMCRVYNIGGKLTGMPNMEMIRKALIGN